MRQGGLYETVSLASEVSLSRLDKYPDTMTHSQFWMNTKERTLMAKRISYQTERSQRINDRMKDLQRELPVSCTDYFRSISQTTSPLTRLAYAYDLRLFFQYLNLSLR